MGVKSEQAEKPTFGEGDRVRFKTGRAGTEFVARITGEDGQFFVTVDDEGKSRKVRKGGVSAA